MGKTQSGLPDTTVAERKSKLEKNTWTICPGLAPGLPDTTVAERKKRKNKVKLSDEEWKAKLTPEQYNVCRQHGNERVFTGELNESKGKGIYKCACCGADIFNSTTKFDSSSGWPCFFDTLKDKDDPDLPAVDSFNFTDRSAGMVPMVLTEVTCGKCDCYLGHVFKDGQTPTGLRYGINSTSLQFKTEEKVPKSEL